jgi:hypothetical protein
MDRSRTRLLHAPLLLLLVVGCQHSTAPATDSAAVAFDGRNFRISGPYAHENVSVFLLHTDEQDPRTFLTLDEGLPAGLVKVTEQDQERVDALQLENASDNPLYLQEGERLSGGKQDRIIIASLVVPPHSGKVPVPTFCVEHGRWREGTDGRRFGATANPALASKNLRGAAKVDGSQTGVWSAVDVQKASGTSTLHTRNTNSSFNETFDAPETRKLADEYAAALSAVLPQHPDAVGVAILVNGQIEEVNIYPNHQVLVRLYPRLVQSYAFQARLLKDAPPAPAPLAAADVARFLREGSETEHQNKNIDDNNRLSLSLLEGKKYKCTTEYDGKVIHSQVLKKNGAPEEGNAAALPARAARLGNDW